MKTNEKKQIKAIQNQGQVDSPLILEEKEIFNKLANEKLNEIIELDNKVDTGNLTLLHHDTRFAGTICQA